MLARKFRLPIKEFKGHSSKSVSTPYFTVKSLSNCLSYNRLGVIISSKVVGKATRRNYWKRRITQNFQTWPQSGKDVLIIVNPGINNLKESNLEREMYLVSNKTK